MLQEKGLESYGLRRSQCAAHTASELGGLCSFDAWRLCFLRVPGERVCGSRLNTAEALSRMNPEGWARINAADRGRWASKPISTRFGVEPHTAELPEGVADVFLLMGNEFLLATRRRNCQAALCTD